MGQSPSLKEITGMYKMLFYQIYILLYDIQKASCSFLLFLNAEDGESS
jgi:hypothetical protein